MALHVFRYRDTDIFALTYDEAGANLPARTGAEWRFIEALDPVHFTWGAENFGSAWAALDASGYFLFEGEMTAAESVPTRPSYQRRRPQRVRSRR
jgi:hypothetical protein